MTDKQKLTTMTEEEIAALLTDVNEKIIPFVGPILAKSLEPTVLMIVQQLNKQRMPNGNIEFADSDLQAVSFNAHGDVRKKVWADAFNSCPSGYHDQRVLWADKTLAEFDKKFPS